MISLVAKSLLIYLLNYFLRNSWSWIVTLLIPFGRLLTRKVLPVNVWWDHLLFSPLTGQCLQLIISFSRAIIVIHDHCRVRNITEFNSAGGGAC